MASSSEDFTLWLKSKWDGDAMKAAQDSFERTQKKAGEADSAMKDLGLTTKDLKEQLVGLVAAGAVWDQFEEGFEQVAALEQAMNQLERATQRNSDNFEEVKGKIVGMAESLKKAAGVDDDAAIRGMVDLYNATGDVGNSMDLVRLATDVSIGGNIKFEEALQMVTGAAQGKTRALVALKLAKDEDSAATLTAQEALNRIEGAFGGAAEKATGLKVELNRANEAWEDIRNTTVERVIPSLEAAVKVVISFFVALDGAWRIVSDAFVGTLGFLGKFGSYMKALLTGDVQGMKDAVVAMGQEAKGAQDSIVQGAKETAKKLEDVWSDAREKITITSKTPKAIGGGTGGKKDDGKQRELTEAEEQQMLLAQFERELYLKRLKEAEKFEAAKLALQKVGAKETERIEKQLDAERERMMDAQTRRILDQVRLQKQAEQAKREQAWQTADAAIGAAYSIFGESKEIAIAEAVINTFKGATAAYPNFVLMALIIASGLAQVAKIRSTEPGGGGDATAGRGFDVPAYDAAARAGGRRWAMDMIGEFSGGVREGWSEGMGGFGGRSITTDNSRTYNIHFHGAGFLDPALIGDAKKLKRSIDVIDRTIDSQRTVARARRS